MVDSIDVSVVVPAKDERDNLAPLVGEIDAALGGRFEYELIYVDDGSVDGSHVVLRDLQTRFTRLKVLRHVHAVGQSMAVLSGVRHGRGDWLVVLDGDGQNDPADIPRLLDLLDQPEVIDGSAEQLSGSGSPARNARTVARPCGVASMQFRRDPRCLCRWRY